MIVNPVITLSLNGYIFSNTKLYDKILAILFSKAAHVHAQYTVTFNGRLSQIQCHKRIISGIRKPSRLDRLVNLPVSFNPSTGVWIKHLVVLSSLSARFCGLSANTALQLLL